MFLFGCLSLLSPPYSSFLHLKSVRSSPFSHAGLLLYLLSILNIRMDCSAALRRLSLKIKQLSWVSLPSRADSQEILLTSSLNKPKSTCLKFQVIIILLAFLTSLRFLTSHLMTLQPSIPKTVLPYSGEAGPASTSPAPAPKCCPSIHLPNCLSPSHCPFQQIWAVSRSPERVWPMIRKTSLFLDDQHELTAEYSYWDFIGRTACHQEHAAGSQLESRPCNATITSPFEKGPF